MTIQEKIAIFGPDEDEDMMQDPDHILESICYGMVEGHYMPPYPARETVELALTGTWKCLDDMSRAAGVYPEWTARMFNAMLRDERLMKALVYRVFDSGWTQGGALRSMRLPELARQFNYPLTVRMWMYIVRFKPAANVYRECLDVIPNVLPGYETPIWEVFVVAIGVCLKQCGTMAEATEYIQAFPRRPDPSREGGDDE